jgi:drug/metabolite transporter (DMT)-like permease
MPPPTSPNRRPSAQRRHTGVGRAIYRRPRLFLRFERRQWYRLTPGLRALCWAVGAALTFSFMGLLAKDLGQRYNPIQVAFFRSSFGMIPLLPIFLAGGLRAFRTARPLQHLLRGLVGVTGMFLGFYAVARLPLATSTAISFTTPLYMIVMAVLFLGEQVRWRRWTATLVGFAGVVIIVRPFDGVVSPPELLALASAFIASIAITLVKRLSGTEPSVTIVFYLSLIATICSAVPSWFVWRSPGAFDLFLFLLVGLAGGAGQILITQAYFEGEATAVAPVDYLRLLFAILFGYLVFGELPTRFTLIGSAVIIGSTLYIAHRERQLRHPPPHPGQIAIKTH